MPGERVLVVDDSPTILKVVQMVLGKVGYVVRVASDGEEGLRSAREERPDLILLDFVMPKMNGYQMCRALAEEESLRTVPVVLMSAKGDQVGERFVKVMGIVDYITKPFSPDAITAVVDHTIAKYGPSSGQTPRPELSLEGIDAMVEVAAEAEDDPEPVTGEPAPLGPPPQAGGTNPSKRAAPPVANEAEAGEPSLLSPPPPSDRDSTARRKAVSAGPRKQPWDAIREALAAAAADDLVGDELADKIRARLSDEVIERVLRAYVAPPAEPQVVLEGDLASVPIAQVLGLLQEQRQTGVLVVRREPATVEVHFRTGKVDFAGSIGLGDEFQLGRFLVAREAITRQDLDLFLQSRSGQQRLIGEQLVKMSYITEADLRGALMRQTCERVFEVLRWAGGRFAFRSTIELGALAESASLGLTVDAILMEGLRRVDEWHLIEREVDDFDAVFLRNEELVKEIGRGQLTREELQVLELVTGKHTVKDIVRLSRMGSFDVSKMLFRLKSTRLIRRRVAPVAV